MPSATSIILPADPMLRAINYLSRYFPRVCPEVPPGWVWDDLLIIVTDVGGTGFRDYVLDDARLMVEVSHPDHETASKTARTVMGLLRAWPDNESGVYWRGSIMRPTWSPDPQTRVPAYALTVALSFRGETLKITIQ